MPEPQRLERAVGDQEHGAADQELGGEVLQPMAGDRVEGRERLVHQDDRAVLHERAGQGGPLAHAAGKRGRAGGRRRPPRPTRAEQLVAGSRRRRSSARDAPRSRWPRSTLSSTGSQGSSRSCCAISAMRPSQAAAVVGDHQSARREARDQAQQRGLADARRAEQAGPAAALEAEAQPLEQRRALIGQGAMPMVTPGGDQPSAPGRSSGRPQGMEMVDRADAAADAEAFAGSDRLRQPVFGLGDGVGQGQAAASSAAIADDRVQPVPWVWRVAMRGGSSQSGWPVVQEQVGAGAARKMAALEQDVGRAQAEQPPCRSLHFGAVAGLGRSRAVPRPPAGWG